ncbi:MAG: EamA family transporter [Chloroflexi bacterium]|nr:EamA family transporter [Chloroflexota bacterium]
MLIALAALLWGTTGTAQALGPAGITPLTVGALRILVGGVALLAWAAARGNLRSDARWHRPTVLLAGAGIALYQPAFFGGTQQTGVAVGTIIAIGSAPVFAGIISLLRGERPTRRWLLATTLAVAGTVVLIAAGGGDQTLTIRPAGVLLALTAGLAYVLYAAAIQRLTADHPAEAVVAVTMSLGALLLLPLLIIGDLAWVGSVRGVAVVLHLGLIATGLSYVSFGYGVRQVPIASVATLTLTEPLTAALLGIVVLGEPLAAQTLAGMILVFAGLTVLALPARSRPLRSA